jgi:hypothetical protein
MTKISWTNHSSSNDEIFQKISRLKKFSRNGHIVFVHVKESRVQINYQKLRHNSKNGKCKKFSRNGNNGSANAKRSHRQVRFSKTIK